MKTWMAKSNVKQASS